MNIRDNPPDRRGVLYPARLPTFDRFPAPRQVDLLVRWIWIPRWDLEPGVTSRQRLLPFPASNLVVQTDGVTLSGPATGASHRDLTGRGWAVGALLRPAAVPSLGLEPAAIRDDEVPFSAPGLHAAVVDAMASPDPRTGDEEAVRAVAGWVATHLGEPDEAGLVADEMERLIATDRRIIRVEQVADRLGYSMRAVQRLAQRYFGLPPLAVIRRYRLQEAAQRLRTEPGLTIARVAADLGYADHAHLSTDFRRVLGITARDYRADGSGAPA